MAVSVQTVSVQTESPGTGGEVLRIAVSEQAITITVALEGEWDLAGQDAMRHAVGQVLARQPEHVVLDLSRLTFIDSSGMHATVDLAARAARLKIGLAIVPGPPAVQRPFEICGLTERLPFVASASSA